MPSDCVKLTFPGMSMYRLINHVINARQYNLPMHLYFVLPYAIERHLKTCFPGWPSPPCLSPLQYVVHSGLLQSEGNRNNNHIFIQRKFVWNKNPFSGHF